MLRFNDGVSIDTSGELRVLRLSDGLYVVGRGMCIPVNNSEEAVETIRQMTTVEGTETNESKT